MLRTYRDTARVLLAVGLGVAVFVSFLPASSGQPRDDEPDGRAGNENVGDETPPEPPSQTDTIEDESRSPSESAVSESAGLEAADLEAAENADAQLESQLRTVFAKIDTLASTDASVTSGVVQLTGEVDEPTAKETAETIAKKFDHTLYVQNEIAVTTQVSERLSPALQRARDKLREFVGYLPLFAVALVILALFWFAARLVGSFGLPGSKLNDRPFLQNIVRQILSVVVFLIGVLFVLDLFGITTLVGAVLGTAGLAGLALGFAFRDIAENYLASIILSFHQPFGKNDLIQVDEYEGKVVRMTTRETVLMTLSGNHIRIPNSTVFKQPTYNFSRNPRRRFEFRVGIGVDEEIGDVQRIGIETIRETEGVTAEPEPFAFVDELGDSTVVLSFYGWVDQADYDFGRVKSESIRRVKNALDAAGVEMPEPTYRVWTRDYRPDADVDTKRRRAEEELREPGMEVEASPEIEEQIETDRAQSGETDLLSD